MSFFLSPIPPFIVPVTPIVNARSFNILDLRISVYFFMTSTVNASINSDVDKNTGPGGNYISSCFCLCKYSFVVSY